VNTLDSNNPFRSLAEEHLNHNHPLIPIPPPGGRFDGKNPGVYRNGSWVCHETWKIDGALTSEVRDVHAAAPKANLAIVMGAHPDLPPDDHVVSIDADVEDPELGAVVRQVMLDRFGEHALHRMANPDRAGTWYFRLIDAAGCKPSKIVFTGGDAGKKKEIEFRGGGLYSVVAGTHYTGAAIGFTGRHILETPVAEFPALTVEQLHALWERLVEACEDAGFGLAAPVDVRMTQGGGKPDLDPLTEPEADLLLEALSIAKNDLDRPEWVMLNKAVVALCEPAKGMEAVHEALHAFDLRYIGQSDGGEALERVLSERRSLPDHVGFRWLKGLLFKRMPKNDVVRIASGFAALDFPDDLDPEHGIVIRESRFKPIKPGEMKPVLNAAWHIKKLLPSTGLGIIYGAPGSGKTFLALDMVAGVSSPDITEYRGRKTKTCGVAYWFLEGGVMATNRVIAWRQYYGDIGNFASYPHTINLAAPDLDDVDELCNAVLRYQGPVGILVIDTLARSFAGGDENSSKDMSQFIGACKRIGDRLNCLVLVVHHSGKAPTKGSRGHSSLLGAADVEIEVIADRETGAHTARITKLKEAEAGEELGFKLKQVFLGEDEDGESVTTCVVEPLDLAHIKADKAKLPRGPNEALVLDAMDALEPWDDMADGLPAGLPPHAVPEAKLKAYAQGDMEGTAKETSRAVRDAIASLVKRGVLQRQQGHVWR